MNDSIALFCAKMWRHKYWFATLVFLLIIVLLDENNLIRHLQNRREIAALEAEKEKYKRDYEASSRKLQELEADPEMIEKIAREKYGMHTEKEDIFIIED